MDFLKSLAIAASGLKAQSGRMRVISERGKRGRTRKDQSDRTDFRTKYEPGHPAADPRGYVKYPNVNPLIEMTDMRDAQRSYEANLNVIGATRRMIQRTLAILTG